MHLEMNKLFFLIFGNGMVANKLELELIIYQFRE